MPVHLSVPEVDVGATDRLEYRVSPEAKALIGRAAALVGLTPSNFARTAAEERAAEVVREHESVTYVPNEFFDEMLAWLDEPPVVDPKLVDAFVRLRDVVRSD